MTLDQYLAGVTIVIPTRGRVDLTRSLLNSLAIARKAYPAPSEVIVVDDSSPNEKRELAALCAQYDCALQDGPASVGSKRNIGLHQARYGITLFVDSDCEAEPQLLVEHARVYEGDESGTIGGCMGPTRFVGPDTWLWKTISYSSYVMPFSFPDMMSEVPWGPSSNLSFRTDVLHKIGGFDETFPARPGGEDVDLGLRVVRQGYRIVANRNAAVMHSTDTWDSLQLMRGRLNQWGRAEDYLHERHPERLTFAQPRFLAVCLLAVAVALVQAVATGKVWYLGLPVVWALTSVSVFAVLTARYMDRAAPTALQQALIVLLNQFFESGLIRQGFRRHTGRPIFQTMLYAEGQLVGEWYHSAYWLISHFFAFVVVGAVILCLR